MVNLSVKSRIGVVVSALWIALTLAWAVDSTDFFVIGIIPLVLGWGIAWIIIGFRQKQKKESATNSPAPQSDKKVTTEPEVLKRTEFTTANTQTVNPKYYNWLIYSVGGSLLLIGGASYATGGGLPMALALLIDWGLRSLIAGVFWGAIVAAIARGWKKNWRNAFLGTFAIVSFAMGLVSLASR